MAVIGFATDLYGNPAGLPSDPSTAQIASVAADVAVLVADGASPTQGHVTTLNTDWGVVFAAFTAAPTSGLKVIIDTAMTKNQAIAALSTIARWIRTSSLT